MPELVVRPQKIKVFGRPEGGQIAQPLEPSSPEDLQIWQHSHRPRHSDESML